jgi:hypothetical protein
LAEVGAAAGDTIAGVLPVALCCGPEFAGVNDCRQPGQDLLRLVGRDFVRMRDKVKLADSDVVGLRVLFAEELNAPHGTSSGREQHGVVGIGCCMLADDATGQLLDRRVDEESWSESVRRSRFKDLIVRTDLG